MNKIFFPLTILGCLLAGSYWVSTSAFRPPGGLTEFPVELIDQPIISPDNSVEILYIKIEDDVKVSALIKNASKESQVIKFHGTFVQYDNNNVFDRDWTQRYEPGEEVEAVLLLPIRQSGIYTVTIKASQFDQRVIWSETINFRSRINESENE